MSIRGRPVSRDPELALEGQQARRHARELGGETPGVRGEAGEGAGAEDAVRMGAQQIVLVTVQLRSLDQLHWEEVLVMSPQPPSSDEPEPPSRSASSVTGVKVIDHPREVENRDPPVGCVEEEVDA